MQRPGTPPGLFYRDAQTAADERRKSAAAAAAQKSDRQNTHG